MESRMAIINKLFRESFKDFEVNHAWSKDSVLFRGQASRPYEKTETFRLQQLNNYICICMTPEFGK